MIVHFISCLQVVQVILQAHTCLTWRLFRSYLPKHFQLCKETRIFLHTSHIFSFLLIFMPFFSLTSHPEFISATQQRIVAVVMSHDSVAASAGVLRVVWRPHWLSVHYSQLHWQMGKVVEESSSGTAYPKHTCCQNLWAKSTDAQAWHRFFLFLFQHRMGLISFSLPHLVFFTLH